MCIGKPIMATNPKASRVVRAMHENFAAIGLEVRETATATVLHYPHLVSFASMTPAEQREQVDALTRDAIKIAGVEGVTYELRDTAGRECGNPNWWQFYVEISVPK